MIIPQYLKAGDTVAIISTARKVTIEDVYPAVSELKTWGVEVVLGPNLFEAQHQFAGTDEERANDFLWAWQNPQIKAIICARGGYGTIRIIEKIKPEIFKENQKWLVGFSDITVLLSLLYRHQIPSIHGIMPLLFKKENALKSVESLKNTLFGKPLSIEIPYHPFNKPGKSEGILIGGNLSILNNLIDTPADVDFNGKILFIEDLDEYLYHIDRMMMHLKLAGKLKKLKGLIVGHMTDMKDNAIPFGKSAYEIIAESVSAYSYPVCYGFPAGHAFDNLALKMGMPVEMAIYEKQSVIIQK